MLVKELNDESPGYHPFLIKEYWQVAKLNYCRSQDAKNIKDLEVHEHTDETFTLLKGSAFLIAAKDEQSEIEMVLLQQGITYNKPAGVWHNIAMREGCSVLITENAGTHKEEKRLCSLPEIVQKQIREFQNTEVAV